MYFGIMGHLYYKQHLEEKKEKEAATSWKSKIKARNHMK